LERRAPFPGGQENCDSVYTAHHVHRVVAGAARRKLHQTQRVGNVEGRVQQRVQRDCRTDCQQQLRDRDTAVRQFHAKRYHQVRAY